MSIKTRLEAIERMVPDAIVLKLDDGSTFEHPGPAIAFYMEGMRQIAKKRGPIYHAALHYVSATGCGRMHELLRAMALGPVKRRK